MKKTFILSFLVFLSLSAETEGTKILEKNIAQQSFVINNLWILISALLVFIMHLGFASIEAGLTRGKNTVNILFKNVSIISIGLLTYALLGFSLMYPGENWLFSKYLGFAGFGLSLPEGAAGLIDYANGQYSYLSDFIFQGMFAATAATIVSGAVAERIKINSFLIFSTIFVGLVYPISGSWKWGGGWLDQLGFYDFAGSTLVHSIGGWGALAGAMLLGPRIGKYSIDKKALPLPGDNIPLATVGMFLLWFGWYGFNGGSVLSADPAAVSLVVVTTSLAAAAGIGTAILANVLLTKKYDLTMALNGALAGLVGITASADVVTPFSAIIIGAIAGILVVVSIILIDNVLRIDDPVGAISVHLVCGIWGTLAVGIFSIDKEHLFLTQLIGVVSYALIGFLSSLVIFTIIHATIGLRVSNEEEIMGLDISEHGMEAYHSFQLFSNK